MERRARGNGATLPKGDSLAKMDDPRRGWRDPSTQIRGDTLFHDQINFIHESENLTKKFSRVKQIRAEKEDPFFALC